MKNTALFLLLCFLVVSCKENNKEDFYSYTFRPNAQIILEDIENGYMKYTRVELGTNLVFEYEFEQADEEMIADDEYTEYIRFEIDPDINKFIYTDNELTSINTYLTEVCFCGYQSDETKNVPPTGSISGVKQSETAWEITIDVIFYGDEARTISETFTLQE